MTTEELQTLEQLLARALKDGAADERPPRIARSHPARVDRVSLLRLNHSPHRRGEMAELEPGRERPNEGQRAVELDRPLIQRLTNKHPPKPHPVEGRGVGGHQEINVGLLSTL